MRNVTLSGIQPPNARDGSTVGERKADNIRIAFSMMAETVKRGADLICLPETFQVTGLGSSKETARQLADEEGGELSQKLCAFARKNHVDLIAPVLGRYGTTLRNVAWGISRDGEHIGRYFKVHCTQGETDKGVVPGEEWPILEFDFGRVGVMICHDNSWPESARCLALNGAEVVCWPHVQSGWGEIVWDITLRSRAVDNAVYLLSACYGVPDGTAWQPGLMMGRTGIVGPDGTVLVDAGRIATIVSSTVDLDSPVLRHSFSEKGTRDYRARMFADRRPETYAPLTQPKQKLSHEHIARTSPPLASSGQEIRR